MPVLLTHAPLSLDRAYETVRGPGMGGVAIFCGDVRDLERGRPIASIEYEAYEPMARRDLEKIVRESERRHGANIAVFHRLGSIPAGETSVIVAAAAKHRAEAFAACREVIDRLKETVPIWKTAFLPAAGASL